MYARLKCCMHNVCAVCMGYASIMHENAYHMHTPCIPHAYCNNLLHKKLQLHKCSEDSHDVKELF